MTGELSRNDAHDNGVRYANALKRERKYNPSYCPWWQTGLAFAAAVAVAVALVWAFLGAIDHAGGF